MASLEPRDLEQVVRDGLSTLVFGFGYRVGIVDGFIKTKQPCTAEELAQKINMKKRYIEEWLSCLAAAGIVRVYENDRFSLPYDESVLTTQGHLASSLPIFCESIPKLEKVIFADGPRGYIFTASFLKFVEGWSTPVAIENWVKTSLEPVLNLNDGIISRDRFTLLDLGCGRGKHAIRIAKLYPPSSVYGVDMDQPSIDQANVERLAKGIKNVNFSCSMGGNLPTDWTEKFDFVVINQVLHVAPGVDALLSEVKRVLKFGGIGAAYDPPVSSCFKNQANDKIAQQELPFGFFLCLPMSLSGPSWTDVGLGEGWGYERRKAKIEEHGFRVIPCGDIDINVVQERIVFKK